MSLITTPTIENANSYVTLAEVEAYFLNRQDILTWSSLSNNQKEAILIMATNHIDSFRFFNCEIVDRPKFYRNKQSLKFPRHNYSQVNSGTVKSSGNNFIIDSSRVNNSYEPNDFWNDGAIIITDGTGKGQTRKITDFDMETGKITISENWTINPDTSSQYYLVEKINDEIKNAVCEQALFISKTANSSRQTMRDSGVVSYRIGDLAENFGNSSNINMSNIAKSYLSKFINRTGRIIV